jgi:predicted ATPase
MVPEPTNWIVLTGAPSSGKSKVIEHLAFLGFSVRPEAARIHLDDEMSRGRKLEEIRSDEGSFQKQICEMKVKIESLNRKDSLIFWDRGMPDSIVYLRHYGQDEQPAVRASQRFRYQQIFLLDRLPDFSEDGVRTESSDWGEKIQEELYQCYTDLGYPVLRIPVGSISERVRFILKNIEVD